MDKKLKQVLEGYEDNYIFPFFWMHEGKTEKIPERIEKIYESGCRAFCVESRPHEGFCRQSWWEDMEIVLEEAQKRNMKVWILDDKHFPTGYANGILKEKYQSHRKWFLREHHVDVIGPMKEAGVLLPRLNEENEETILGAVAYKRSGKGEELVGDGILLTEMEQGFLFWDVPEGVYRIFFIIQSRRGSYEEMYYNISGIDETSVHALIEAVYEPHYQHFSKFFGNTIAGFFSDEPGIYNEYLGGWGKDPGRYYRTVGQPGVALPWGEEASIRMEEFYTDHIKVLPGLWYKIEEISPKIRLDYMDIITRLWKKNFSKQLSTWCHEHGVLYTGHVVEDMNADMRLGMSAGHYFRNLAEQDMSGIDIVLHQVMPGFAEYDVAAMIANGIAGNEFFHYVLPKLGSSLARISPHMNGKAMCEVFGAYGWAEGSACMKWLIDFLMVRGINRFVPHAFTDIYPDADCPPHFYADGHNPQFEGFSKLMQYVNKMSHLLSECDMQTDAAVLYMAEAEWMSSPSYRTMNHVVKALYDAHIDLDILPLDALETAEISEQQLYVNGHAHKFLVIPYAEHYPEKLYEILKRYQDNGFPVFWVGAEEDKSIEEILMQIKERSLAWRYHEAAPHLRIAHFKRELASMFFVFEEDIQKGTNASIKVPCSGDFLRIDLLNQTIVRDYTNDGSIDISLTPYQSELIYFDCSAEMEWQKFPQKTVKKIPLENEFLWTISLFKENSREKYAEREGIKELFSITGKKGWPDFSGKILYQTQLWLDNVKPMELDLGQVGGTAKLSINGKSVGMRICAPYRWDITDFLKEGDNEIQVEVANTLVHQIKDKFSTYMQIAPSGILGPVKLYLDSDFS